MGTGIGGGCSPSRRAWLGGRAPAWGPLWEPPQYRGSSSSRFKVELIQRGQPSHLETQKETRAGSGGGGVSQGGAGPAGPFAPGSQTPKGRPCLAPAILKIPTLWDTSSNLRNLLAFGRDPVGWDYYLHLRPREGKGLAQGHATL